MKKLLVMVVMLMAMVCVGINMNNDKVEESAIEETEEVVEESKSLDEIINEKIDKYVEDEDLLYMNKEVDVRVEDGDTIVSVTYFRDGFTCGYDMFRIPGTVF